MIGRVIVVGEVMGDIFSNAIFEFCYVVRDRSINSIGINYRSFQDRNNQEILCSFRDILEISFSRPTQSRPVTQSSSTNTITTCPSIFFTGKQRQRFASAI